MAALGSVDLVVGKNSDKEMALAQKLKFGFTGDVVIEMGIAMFRLARLVNPSDFKDLNRLALKRARRRGLDNLVLVRGEALYILSAFLPQGFAATLHVYFPDPWPKNRHHKRRLFDPETVDLVLALLRPGGQLCFATDYLEYGAAVVELLEGFPALRVERLSKPWPDGARTNYEAKYMAEGRPILRFRAFFDGAAPARSLHPRGRRGILVGPRGSS